MNLLVRTNHHLHQAEAEELVGAVAVLSLGRLLSAEAAVKPLEVAELISDRKVLTITGVVGVWARLLRALGHHGGLDQLAL